MSPNKQAKGDRNGEKTLVESRLGQGASSPLARQTNLVFVIVVFAEVDTDTDVQAIDTDCKPKLHKNYKLVLIYNTVQNH